MKKFLALLLACALALGLLAMTATASNADEADYCVGYAKVDLNPYWSVWEAAGNQIPQQAVTSDGEAVTSNHIMPLPMGGYGGNAHRLSRPELVDDNGSGLHNESAIYLDNNRYTEAFAAQMGVTYADGVYGQNDGDGIYGTCVAIRQNPTAEPVLYISVDFIGMANAYCGIAKNTIIRALKAEGITISPDRILINATHTHGSISLGEEFSAGTTYQQKLYGNTETVDFLGRDLTSYLSTYRSYLYSQLAAAAVQALTEDASNGVTMRKGTVDVSDLTGYTLNGVRHKKAQVVTNVNGTEQTVDYVTGSSFNVGFKNNDGTSAKSVAGVSESDDRLHVLEFSFDDPNLQPVLMINWRAHTTLNNKMSSRAYNNLSADFVAAMRYKLESWGYRPILSYGASGNLGVANTPSTYNMSTGNNKDPNDLLPGVNYGNALAMAAAWLVDNENAGAKAAFESNRNNFVTKRDTAASNAAAQESEAADYQKKADDTFLSFMKTYYEEQRDACLASAATYRSTEERWAKVVNAIDATEAEMTACAQGAIRLESTWYDVRAQKSSDAGYEAAKYHNALAVDEGGSAANDGGLKLEKSGYPFLVKAGTYTANGKTFTVSADFVIASQYHANSLINRHGNVNKRSISLCAFTLGDQVAFVTMPFESSDRYSMEATLATANDYNDWDNLVNENKWGTPFVVSLVNGTEGYFPNNLAYTYDQDLEKAYIASPDNTHPFVAGSYEGHTAYAQAGQGEAIVARLNSLLRSLEDSVTQPETITGYCQGCQKNVTWYPLDNKTTEDVGNHLTEGHYYLAADFENNYGTLTIDETETFCLELNGHTLYTNMNTGASRSFLIYGTANIQDSVGGGIIKSKTTSNNGSTIHVSQKTNKGKGILNLYSGTITGTGEVATHGGNIYVLGQMNMYGGTVSGGKAHLGGNVYIAETGVFNLHGGTIQDGEAACQDGSTTANDGGNVYVNAGACFNMYGGTIQNGVANRYGGNVSVQDSDGIGAYMAMYGGTIKGGSYSATSGVAGRNILLSGKSTLRYVNGTIQNGSTTTHLMGAVVLGDPDFVVTTPMKSVLSLKNYATVTLDGVFTGKVELNYSGVKNDKAPAYPKAPAYGDVIGAVNEGAQIDHIKGIISITGLSADYSAAVSGSDLIVSATPVAFVNGAVYTEINEALAASSQNAPAVLQLDVTGITLTKNGWLDLAGCNAADITTGDHTLYCKDSKTDDYSVADGVYGKITAVSGNVQAIDGYWEITETGARSFHRFAMYMNMLTVNTKKVGLKFEAIFRGDELIKGSIREFGVAVRAYHKPDTNSVLLDTANLTHMALTQSAWQTGDAENAVKSVYVRDIMDPTITADINNARADVPIYTAAYVKLSDGTMLFSEENTQPYNFTMKSAMAHMDSYWASLGQSGRDNLANFYNTYKDEMQSWPGISNIRARANELSAGTGVDIPVN